MQAYYEIETEIPTNHQLNIQLPDSIPTGRAKVAIIYELSELNPNKKILMEDFLASLPDNKTDGLSREDIQAYIEQERQHWGD